MSQTATTTQTTTATGHDRQNAVVVPFNSNPQWLGSLEDRRSALIAMIDNSGSTGGMFLRMEQAFADAMNPRASCLWNSTSGQLIPHERLEWRSTGGTNPVSALVTNQDNYFFRNAEALLFLTDGQIPSTTSLAAQAHLVAHLPLILVIVSNVGDSARTVNTNVSVLLPLFAAAQDAIVLVIGGGSVNNVPRVIQAKGAWASRYDSLPDIQESCLSDHPPITQQELSQFAIRKFPHVPPNSLVIADGTLLVNVDRFLSSAEDIRVLDHFQDDTDITALVRHMHVRQELHLLRQWFQQLDVQVGRQSHAMEQQEQVQEQEQSNNNNGPSLMTLTRRLAAARASGDNELAAQIVSELIPQASMSAESAAVARETVHDEMRDYRRRIQMALAEIQRLQAAGHSATALSNRAARAKTVVKVVPVSELDAEDAPGEEDLIFGETGPVCILMESVTGQAEEANTSDFVLDSALCVGNDPRNQIVQPDLIGMAAIGRIEQDGTSPLARNQIAVSIPILRLSNDENRAEIYRRLCRAFMGGKSLQAVWQVALVSFFRTTETKEWAAPGTPVGRCLMFMIQEILSHVVLKAGSRLSPLEDMTLGGALVRAMGSDIMTQHYPLSGVLVAARLLSVCPQNILTRDFLLSCVRARLHAEIAQYLCRWLKNGGTLASSPLNAAIYQTHVNSNNEFVPISGRHQLVDTLQHILHPETVEDLDEFVQRFLQVNEGADALIVPETTAVVRAALSSISSNHSSSAAVDATRRAHPHASAALDPRTIGLLTSEQVLQESSKALARMCYPVRPMAAFGRNHGASASVLWWYHGLLQNGRVSNMTEGFVVDRREDRSQFLTRLAEHIRSVRAKLAHDEQGYTPEGFFGAETQALPIHRVMATVWNKGIHPDDPKFIPTVITELMDKRLGNLNTAELEIRVSMLTRDLLQTGSMESFGLSIERAKPLETRIDRELNGRTLSELAASTPPPAVWIPLESVEHLERVSRAKALIAQKVQQAVQASAASATRNGQGSGDTHLVAHNDSRLGRLLSMLLRHRAETFGLSIRSDGYVRVQELQDYFADNGRLVTLEQLQRVVANCPKNRFGLLAINNGIAEDLYIRAHNGHSIVSVTEEDVMTRIKSPTEAPAAIHGTTLDAWNVIQSTELQAMGRNSIQMAVGPPEDPTVTSGVRPSSQVLIYVNIGLAMDQHGIPFYRTANNVICSPGPIPTSCFERVVRRSDGCVLWENCADGVLCFD